MSTPLPTSSTFTPAKPDNSLILAIFSTLCCCVPTGIAAIVFAAQVDSKHAAGDYAGANDSAEKAKLWSWISIGLGVAGTIAYFALAAAGVIDPNA